MQGLTGKKLDTKAKFSNQIEHPRKKSFRKNLRTDARISKEKGLIASTFLRGRAFPVPCFRRLLFSSCGGRLQH